MLYGRVKRESAPPPTGDFYWLVLPAGWDSRYNAGVVEGLLSLLGFSLLRKR
jgi:hypothetical protein